MVARMRAVEKAVKSWGAEIAKHEHDMEVHGALQLEGAGLKRHWDPQALCWFAREAAWTNPWER
eukprot:11180358-Lingulodinium_polyedra.AAC.1